MSSVPGHWCSADPVISVAPSLAAGPDERGRGAVAEEGGGDDVGFREGLAPEGQSAKLDADQQHEAARRCLRELGGEGEPGDAAGAAKAEHRDAGDVRPEAQPLGAARLQAGRRNPGGRDRHDRVDVRGFQAGLVQRVLGGRDEQLTAPLEIGAGPLRPSCRLGVPGNRLDRAAGPDAGVLEDGRDPVELAPCGVRRCRAPCSSPRSGEGRGAATRWRRKTAAGTEVRSFQASRVGDDAGRVMAPYERSGLWSHHHFEVARAHVASRDEPASPGAPAATSPVLGARPGVLAERRAPARVRPESRPPC